MTGSPEERVDESSDRTSGEVSGARRRPLLKALGAGGALAAVGGVSAAGDDGGAADGLSQPEGFETEVIAPHATFPDAVAAAFGVAYEDGGEDAALLRDASTVLVVRAHLDPGGTSGWHGDSGPVIVNVVEGEVDVTFDVGGECVTRTYAAGEGLIATGRHDDVVENASDGESAEAYLIFLGVPAGEPPSSPVEPPDC